MNDASTGETTAPRLWRVGTLTYTAGGIAVLFCWLLWGDLAWSLKERAAASVATLMIKSFEVSDFIYGLIILTIPNITNIILVPIVSYRSDRHRGRWGRRIPYLWFTTPFVAVGMTGIGAAPFLGRLLSETLGPELLSYRAAALTVFCIFWFMLDFGTTLANGIFVALVNDVVPRDFLGRFFGLFRAISLIAGILFNYFIFGHAEKNFFLIFAGLAAIYAAGFVAVCLKVKEGEYPPLSDREKKPHGIVSAIRSYFSECFGHSFYRWVILAYVTCGLANIPFNAYTIFYAKSIGVGMAEVGKYLAYTYVISLFLSYFLGVLADRFHPIRTGMVSIFIYGIVSLCGIFFIRSQTSFAVIMILHGVITGSYFTLSASYAQKLFPRELFAQFNSAMAIVVALSWVFVSTVIGSILDLSGHRYELVWYAGAFFSFMGIAFLWIVYRKYLALGGDADYQAPPVRRE